MLRFNFAGRETENGNCKVANHFKTFIKRWTLGFKFIFKFKLFTDTNK